MRKIVWWELGFKVSLWGKIKCQTNWYQVSQGEATIGQNMVYVLGGKCPGGKCPGGICPRGYMSQGVSVPGISVQGLSVRGVYVQGSCPRTIL